MALLTPNNVADFWNRGFALYNLGLDDDECRDALEEVEALRYEPIFGEVYEETRDQFREQVNITTLTPTLAAIHHSIVNLVSINEDWVVDETSWYALRLHPGGHDQAVNRDFPTFKTARALLTHELVQASVIVALMNDTYLHAYPGSFGGQVERTKRRTVRLDAGHLIIFRGDLAHAGAGFRGSNVRLHCYVRVNGVPQEPDSTEAVVFRSYRCGRRMQLTYSRAELSEHRQACVLRGGPYRCPFCGQMYAIRNSLNQHVRRRHREPQEQEASSEGSWSGSDSAEESESSEEA